MKNSLPSLKSICCLLFMASLQVHAIGLKEALAQKLVTLDAKWKCEVSGAPLSLKLRNITPKPLKIEVQPGYYFQADDDKAQNMLVIQDYVVSIPPNGAVEKALAVNCMEIHDYGPHLDGSFSFMGDAPEKLRALAQVVAKSDKYTYISQGLVWALAENNPEFAYSKGDSVACWPVLNVAKSYIKLQLTKEYTYVPIPRITFSSRVNMSTYVGPNTQLTLVSADKEGNVLREFFANKPVAAGFYNVTIGFNEIVSDSAFLINYKLTDNTGKVLLEKKTKNNTMEPAEKVYWLTTAWEMNIEQPVTGASMKLYGPDEKLLLVLYENRNLPVGIRRTPYGFFHTYGKKSKFKVRLQDASGATVKEVEVDGSNSEEKVVQMKKKEY